jgi:hypothetical protein
LSWEWDLIYFLEKKRKKRGDGNLLFRSLGDCGAL